MAELVFFVLTLAILFTGLRFSDKAKGLFERIQIFIATYLVVLAVYNLILFSFFPRSVEADLVDVIYVRHESDGVSYDLTMTKEGKRQFAAAKSIHIQVREDGENKITVRLANRKDIFSEWYSKALVLVPDQKEALMYKQWLTEMESNPEEREPGFLLRFFSIWKEKVYDQRKQ